MNKLKRMGVKKSIRKKNPKNKLKIGSKVCINILKKEDIQKFNNICEPTVHDLVNENVNNSKSFENVKKEIHNPDNYTLSNDYCEVISYLSEYMKEAIDTQNFDSWHDISEIKSSHTYKWIITDYSIKGRFRNLKSPIFPVSGSSWNLILHPDELILVNNDVVSNSLITGNLTVVGTKQLFNFPVKHHFINEKKFSIKDFINYKNIIQSASEFLPNDILTIVYEYEEVKLIEEKAQNIAKFQRKKYIPYSLISQFDIPMNYDIEFHVSGAKFTAHKVIIKLRCPKFWEEVNITDHNVDELIIIKISKITPKVFREFLRYIYTEKIDDSESIAESLIALANKYSLKHLKAQCENILMRKINLDNSLHLLSISNHLNAEKISFESCNFILKNLHKFSFDEFYNKFLPCINNTKLEKSDCNYSFSTNHNQVVQETQLWTFHNITTSSVNILSTKVSVGKNLVDFSFTEDDSNNISLTILPRRVTNVKWINIEVVVKNSKGDIVDSRHRGSSTFQTECTSIKFDELVKSDYYSNMDKHFEIYTSVWVVNYKNDISKECEFIDKTINCSAEGTLYHDMNLLYNSMMDSDVIIKTDDDEFTAHKIIIGPQSNVFNELIIDHTLKNNQKKIKIDIHFQSNLIREMLRYFYTGKIYDLKRNAEGLLRLAYVLKINSNLKSICENVLGSMINEYNFLEMIKLADKNDATNLKNECMKYLQDHKNFAKNLLNKLNSTMLHSISHSTLKHISMLLEIIEKTKNNQSEVIIL